MNEEKSMTEYKESKGLFQKIKSIFEKLKERFRPKTEVKTHVEEGPGLTVEQLDGVEGGYPNPDVLDFDELEAKINNLQEPNSWNLTEEEHEVVEQGYEEIRKANSQAEQDGKELFEEDLDNVTAGHPIIDDDERI